MTTSTFVKDIVEQLDETMRLIDEAAEQILGLTGRARNLAALARRYVAEGEADQAKADRMKVATERLDQGIERATQQFIERAEQRLEEQAAGHSVSALLGSVGSVVSSHPAVKAAMVEGRQIRTTEELAALMQEKDALGANLTPTPDDLHTAYDAVPAEVPLVAGVDLGAGEDKAGFFVLDMQAHARGEEKWIDAGQVPPEAFSGGVDDALTMKPVELAIDVSGRLCIRNDEGVLVPSSGFVANTDEGFKDGGLLTDEERAIPGVSEGIQMADALRESYEAPMPEMASSIDEIAARDDAGLTDYEAMMASENPHQPVGEEKTEAADVAPQPDEAASVDPMSMDEHCARADKIPVEPIKDGDTLFRDGGAQQAAEPEAGQEEASPAEAAVSPAEPPPPAPTEEETAAVVAPQFGRDRSHRAAPAKDDLYEEVLALWSTTEKTEMQIARATNSTLALVRQYLEQARLDGDERIEARHKGKLKDRRALKAAPDPSVVDPLHVRDLGPSAQECVDAAIADDVGPNISKGVCVVDLTRNMVIGLKGAHTFREPLMAQTVAKLNDGQMYSVEFLAKECGWATPDHLKRAITPMMEQLRSIGVVMTSLPVGLTIRAAD